MATKICLPNRITVSATTVTMTATSIGMTRVGMGDYVLLLTFFPVVIVRLGCCFGCNRIISDNFTFGSDYVRTCGNMEGVRTEATHACSYESTFASAHLWVTNYHKSCCRAGDRAEWSITGFVLGLVGVFRVLVDLR